MIFHTTFRGAMWVLFATILVAGAMRQSDAHEIRPALLEIAEREAGVMKVLWKVPVLGAKELHITPVFPPEMKLVGSVVKQSVPGARIERSTYRIDAKDLIGKIILIDKLSENQIDTLVRVSLNDGRTFSTILQPGTPSFAIPDKESKWQVLTSYWRLGTEHILEGYDHLLFVFALLLIIPGAFMLFKAITAFTIAHSITLGLAALGFVNVPPAPTEAVIALSIVFLAMEILHIRAGRATMTERYPWIVSGLFGLIHGLGFAGALTKIGLPEQEIPTALLAFNLGVETGQILFILVVLAVFAVLRRLPISWPTAALWRVAAYTIGGLASYWMIDRIAGFV